MTPPSIIARSECGEGWTSERRRSHSVPSMPQRPLTCRQCGEVIGIYEPLVALFGSVPVRTSRAAAETEQLLVRPCFHADCFARDELMARRALMRQPGQREPETLRD